MTDILSEIKTEMLYELTHFELLLPQIAILADNIITHSANIYAFGIGKSGNMARHFVDLVKSVSIPIFYNDATDLLHGSIGSIKKHDMVILFSQSGNTKELLTLMPFFKQREVVLWGITHHRPSSFEQWTSNIIQLPFRNELRKDCIPTNSCISQLIFSNIIVTILKSAITSEKYALNHPAGAIGDTLKKINDVICMEFPHIRHLSQNADFACDLSSIFLEMTQWQMGCCFFTGLKGELIGILTDGDIRRLLLKKPDRKTIVLKDINTECYVETNSNKLVKECKLCHFIPIVNAEHVLLGVVFNARQNVMRL